MWDNVISYFAKRHLLSNFIFLSVIIGGVVAWQNTKKEELPAVTFDRVRISVSYPGAPAEDVEYFVTKPIEEKVRGLDGVYRITSNSSVGRANISVELEQNLSNIDETITEIRNEVMDVDLPDEVIDDPSIRVFKTAKKAIIDIALYHQDHPILSVEGRKELQQYAFNLENQLLNLPQVNSINKRGYLQNEIQIEAYPERLLKYQIPFNSVMREIKDNNVRKPAGTIETQEEPKVTLLSELNSTDVLKNLTVQGGFEGNLVRLGEVAEVSEGFVKTESIFKVNGHEAIILNVVKNGSHGILEALEAVTKRVENFTKNNVEGTPIRVVLLDDESIDVRNRLKLITTNGSIGFILILITLLIFLNKQAGFWVAMGIPFTVCFSMLGAALMGFTINGITLAAVIIVMGMIVDDAIVVAENITRLHHQGIPRARAVVEGTSQVFLPIVASILTTCVTFVPLYFFTGHFGALVSFIPGIIFLMLGASLFESLFILPGHMDLPILKGREDSDPRSHWFDEVENFYGRFLKKILNRKWLVLILFALLLLSAGTVMTKKMKYVMFPREETRDLVLTGQTAPGTTRYETAKQVQKLEELISPYIGQEVVGFRTSIARSRRGGAVSENKFRTIIEIVPKEEREKSADDLVEEFTKKIGQLDGFNKVQFRKSRWGHDSGSPIEVIVQENNNAKRDQVVQKLASAMKEFPALKNIEIEEALKVPEYRIEINREKIKRLSISPSDVASTFRAALEGTVLFEFSNGDEDVHVRFSIIDSAKDDIEKVLDLPVENKGDYLVPLRSIVHVKKVRSPNSINRRDLKRTTEIFADLNEEDGSTPLEAAIHLEEKVFPNILSHFPTTTLTFGGEVQDTRESRADFRNAVILALALIYIILAILFNSLVKPFIIMMAIPFGLVGIILAFYLHGKGLFGFFGAIGALGLSGVVVNDSIIMLVKLDKSFDSSKPKSEAPAQIASIAQTRLRAVILTTITTVVGVLPTAYGFAGYDAMLAEMMLALTWGMIFGTTITLILIPTVYNLEQDARRFVRP